MKIRPLAVAVFGLALVAGCLVFFRNLGPEISPLGPAPDAASVDGVGPRDPLDQAATRVGSSGRARVDTRGQRSVRVELVRRGRGVLSGEVAWRATAALPPMRGGPWFELHGRDAAVERRAVPRGEMEIEADRGDWVSIAARAVDGRVRYRLVPPSASRQVVVFDFGEDESAVEVVVLAAEDGRVVREGRLQCLEESGSRPKREIDVDPEGVTRLTIPDAGVYLLVAPGATERDESPCTARVAVGRSSDPGCVTLVAPGPRGLVELDLEVAGRAGDGPRRSVALLRRIEDGTLRTYPAARPLRPGTQRLQWRVPVGEYRLETWPAGAWACSEPEVLLSVRVEERTARRIRLVPPVEEPVRLRLEGLDAAQLPVSVLIQSADGVLDAGPSSSPFLGAWKWRDPAGEVFPAAGRTPQWLLAHGRSGTWISEQPWSGNEAILEMRPATWLRVRWVPEQPWPARAWIEVESPLGSDVVPLSREFGRTAGDPVVAFVGGCCLPRDPFELRCVVERGEGHAFVAWSRSVTPNGGNTWVEERPVELARGPQFQ